ncbi:hypothetical protein Pcinc_040073 [Petrolisthes cinctipes]|uniref:Uncharacterized protein n=1 Tax=Petrolisthes cinctipes TaxID=88211 RepID=A0AAE1BMD4_PETCI|nr:hypothetical protein Pcinc_040073 [Petrolisthes cinctipes]
MDNTAEIVILKCVNALELVMEECPSLKHFTDGCILSPLLSCLKNDTYKDDFVTLIPRLESLLRKHFAGPNLIDFESAVVGSTQELTKLCLLLLHIIVITESTLRARLVNSPILDYSTQAKVKYLLEAVQKRGAGLSSRFLNILCTEKLDDHHHHHHHQMIQQCHTPVRGSGGGGGGVGGAEAKTREVKRLQQQQLNTLEEEKLKMNQNQQLSAKKIDKLNIQVQKLEAKLKQTELSRDNMEMKIKSGEELTNQQMTRLDRVEGVKERECFHREYCTIHQVVSTNDELESKNEPLTMKLKPTSADRDRLQEEMITLHQANIDKEDIIELQAAVIQGFQVEVEDLCHYRQEHQALPCVSDGSFSGSPIRMDLPMSSPTPGTRVENLKEAVVDKILQETRSRVKLLEEQVEELERNLNTINRERERN